MESALSLRRALLCLVTLLLIKVCEYLVLEPRLEHLAEQHTLHVKSPKVSHPRCDGCRAVALMFDRLFRVEDAKVEHLGLELTLAEVRDIVDTVCRKDVFRKAKLVLKDGHQRISFPNLETSAGQGLPPLQGEDVDWPQRMATHCQYMADTIYDLWLRTGHGDPADWLEFLCEGEGVFGDCNEEVSPHHWPGEVISSHTSVTLGQERPVT